MAARSRFTPPFRREFARTFILKPQRELCSLRAIGISSGNLFQNVHKIYDLHVNRTIPFRTDPLIIFLFALKSTRNFFSKNHLSRKNRSIALDFSFSKLFGILNEKKKKTKTNCIGFTIEIRQYLEPGSN